MSLKILRSYSAVGVIVGLIWTAITLTVVDGSGREPAGVSSTRAGFTYRFEFSPFVLAAGDTNWIHFACPPADGGSTVSPDTSYAAAGSQVLSPPSRIYQTGTGNIEIIALVACDSLKFDVFGINEDGIIIPDDSVTVGSVTVSNVFGDTQPHRINLTSQFNNVWGYAIRSINAGSDSTALKVRYPYTL